MTARFDSPSVILTGGGCRRQAAELLSTLRARRTLVVADPFFARSDFLRELQSGLERALLRLLAPTRVEAGCINYDMHQAPNDASLFLFHENWTSQEALDRHFQTEHIQRWIQKAESLLAGPMDVTLWRRVAETVE